MLSTGDADAIWNICISSDSGPASINVMAVSGTNLYVGGYFNTINGIPRNNLGRLTTTGTGADVGEWNPNVDGPVYAMAVSGPELFVGGEFTSVGGFSRTSFAKVITTNKGSIDPNFIADSYRTVFSLALDGTRLYAGGGFDTLNGAVSLAIARVNPVTGTRDATFAAQVQHRGIVRAIARQPDGMLIIGGQFRLAGGLERQNLVRVTQDGVVDATWAPDADGSVDIVVVNGTDVYVGGLFTRVGGQT